ncbi:putative inactive leucine-rich repeat receptor-like protein kinase At3g03770 [Curcuma longa]|uniref:putative inactive leucine-rich repeat receptor-like protein kinase At3g03770 n=1 Tax=Curcuma longa TaxID=136217 RepID=UPI003D9DF4B7
MAAVIYHPSCLLILSTILILIPDTNQLQLSEVLSLLRIKRLMNYPPILSRWNIETDFCSCESNPYLTVVCYEESVTQLHIAGNGSSPILPHSFSINSLFAALYKLPNLKVLSLTSLGLWGPLPGKIYRLSSLEILNMSTNYLYGSIPTQVSRLINLQTLILDHNMFSGRIPYLLGELPLMTVFRLKNNSLSGSLPDSFSRLKSLRVLVLSSNILSGELPDLSNLTFLQVLDLENNYFGPRFPSLGRKLITLVLRKNKFSGGLPAEVNSYYFLEKLDISSNRFTGPFMPALLSLPSLHLLSIAGNRFTGMLLPSMPCTDELEYVDLSSNLLTGNLPTCLISNSKNVVRYAANCLGTEDQNQHPFSFCQTEALAVGIVPHKRMNTSGGKRAFLVVVIGGIVASISLVMMVFFAIRRAKIKQAAKKGPRSTSELASVGYSTQFFPDASHMLQTLNIPPYRPFSLKELEDATKNFDTSSFIKEGPYGQMYRGKLKEGTLVAIRCLKLKKAQNPQIFDRHIELISKLRHHHLVSALGHGFEYYPNESSVSRLFLVFEFVSSRTLRSNVSEGVDSEKLTWMQRISAVIGVVKGIQFLHGGMMPGLFGNNLKITNILLDQHLVAKIGSYNLPTLAEDMKCELIRNSSCGLQETNERSKHLDKVDIYDLGVILLEIITGRPIKCVREAGKMQNQLQESTTPEMARRSFVDPVVSNSCSDEFLTTVMGICSRCLSKDPTQRPSIEDVLWNLQFAVQVQESWKGGSHSSGESPSPPSLIPSPLEFNC